MLKFHAAVALAAEAVGTTAEGVGHYPKPGAQVSTQETITTGQALC